MEFKESASVENAERKFVFPCINWLSKNKFEDYLNSGITYMRLSFIFTSFLNFYFLRI